MTFGSDIPKFGCHSHRLQLFADSFRDHQVKCVSHTPATPLIMHLDYVEFTQTLIVRKVTVNTHRKTKSLYSEIASVPVFRRIVRLGTRLL